MLFFVCLFLLLTHWGVMCLFFLFLLFYALLSCFVIALKNEYFNDIDIDREKEKDNEKDVAKLYCTQSMANYSKLIFDICGHTYPKEASRLNHPNNAPLNHQSQSLSYGRGLPFDDSFGMVDSYNINGNYSDSDDEDTNIGITGGITYGNVVDDLNHVPGYYPVSFSKNGGRTEFIANSSSYISDNDNTNNNNISNNNSNNSNNSNINNRTNNRESQRCFARFYCKQNGTIDKFKTIENWGNMYCLKAIWIQLIEDECKKAIQVFVALLEYLFANCLSNHHLSVVEAIGCLIEFRDYHDGNINGIGDNNDRIEKCNIVLDGKLKRREYLSWLENDINDWSTASLFLVHMFLSFNRPYAKHLQLFNTNCLQSIPGIYQVLSRNLAIQPKRICKILYYMTHNLMEQSVARYHNNINDLEKSCILQGVEATIERFFISTFTKTNILLLLGTFLYVILSFRHGESLDISNSDTVGGGERGVCDNYDNIRYITTKMSDTVIFATRQTIPGSDINVSFVKMIFVDNLIGSTFDILRERPYAFDDQVLTLSYSKRHQLMARNPQNSFTYRDTFDKLSNFLLMYFFQNMIVLMSNSAFIESIYIITTITTITALHDHELLILIRGCQTQGTKRVIIY